MSSDNNYLNKTKKDEFAEQWLQACNGVKEAQRKEVSLRSNKPLPAYPDKLFDLGNAVIKKAVDDYRKSIHYLRRTRRDTERKLKYKALYWDCVDFFTSQNFNLYSMADGQAVLDTLRREELKTYGNILQVERTYWGHYEI